MVLKLNPRGHPDEAELAREGDALQLWPGGGSAVTLLDRQDDGMTLLLERIRPGDTLDEEAIPWPEKLALIGGLVARLHRDGGGGEVVVTHGDLHPGNVLRAADRWVAIDPKGARADRHSDVWALICPQAPLPDAPDEAARDLRFWLEIYAVAAGLDADRAAEHVRARAVAEADEWLDLRAVERM